MDRESFFCKNLVAYLAILSTNLSDGVLIALSRTKLCGSFCVAALKDFMAVFAGEFHVTLLGRVSLGFVLWGAHSKGLCLSVIDRITLAQGVLYHV